MQLCERHGIDRAFVDRVFWMVELMEAWFLADRDALASYYGAEFRRFVELRRQSLHGKLHAIALVAVGQRVRTALCAVIRRSVHH